MVGMFVWNDVDMLFALDLYRFFSKVTKKLFFFTSCHWWVPLHMQSVNVGKIWMKLYNLWVKRYDFGYVCILNCALEKIAIHIWGNLGYLGHLIVDRILFSFVYAFLKQLQLEQQIRFARYVLMLTVTMNVTQWEHNRYVLTIR